MLKVVSINNKSKTVRYEYSEKIKITSLITDDSIILTINDFNFKIKHNNKEQAEKTSESMINEIIKFYPKDIVLINTNNENFWNIGSEIKNIEFKRI